MLAKIYSVCWRKFSPGKNYWLYYGTQIVMDLLYYRCKIVHPYTGLHLKIVPRGSKMSEYEIERGGGGCNVVYCVRKHTLPMGVRGHDSPENVCILNSLAYGRSSHHKQGKKIFFLTTWKKPVLYCLNQQSSLYKLLQTKTQCRVRNNRRPSAIFRAFQPYDRPKPYLSGRDGRLDALLIVLL